MKTILKIVILALSIVIAGGVVLISLKTKSEPPQEIKMENQYETDIKQCCDSLKTIDEFYQQFAFFCQVRERVDLFNLEGKLTASEVDNCYDTLVSCYLPLFENQCFQLFNREWSGQDKKSIKKCINYLKATNRVSRFSSAIKEVSEVLQKYDEAVRFSRNVSYSSISEAEIDIEKASIYANSDYLRHCTTIQDLMSRVKVKIGHSHSQKIKAKIDAINEMPTSTMDQLQARNSERKALEGGMWKDYCKNARRLYDSIDCDLCRCNSWW